ncbi:MAG: glutamine-hydrolyzing carbamoyl-phosphate synthase small subunit [Gaiellaceae bacterium]
MSRRATLVLEDGTTFAGRAVGRPGSSTGEACFTTSMAGYEEALTDPSYAAQVLAFSYPLVGNYGIDPARRESARVQCSGVVMRRCRPQLAAWLEAEGIVALEEGDTRALVRRIRKGGVMRCALGEGDPEELRELALAEPHIDVDRMAQDGLQRSPLAYDVCVREPYTLGSGPRCVVLDLGCKRSIVRQLAARAVEVVVVPGSWPAERILELEPKTVLIGNGPGDPAQLEHPIATIRGLLGRLPLFGICLGHQLLGLALGMETFKLPFGHRGANHPVRVRGSSRVLVTVQNHGFAVAPSDRAEISHVSLNDETVEGLEGDGFASVQFHPEAAPGPLDALPFFDRIATACHGASI